MGGSATAPGSASVDGLSGPAIRSTSSATVIVGFATSVTWSDFSVTVSVPCSPTVARPVAAAQRYGSSQKLAALIVPNGHVVICWSVVHLDSGLGLSPL